MTVLGFNRYGKAAIRLVHVDRAATPHRIRDLTVTVQLEGDFVAAHTDGDNASVVATDTMKNTVYALARTELGSSIEAFGLALAGHFTSRNDQVDRATISIREQPWSPIAVGSATSRDAFVRGGMFSRTAAVVAGRSGAPEVTAGLADLTVMKTTRSEFKGFPRDEFTTLPDADDRMMATRMTASWRYGPAAGAELDHDAEFRSIRTTLTEVFADHFSPSVQASIWLMGRAVLEKHASVAEISLSMPNLHHWLVDLSPFGLDNPDAVYVATAEPHGLIEATIRRSR